MIQFLIQLLRGVHGAVRCYLYTLIILFITFMSS